MAKQRLLDVWLVDLNQVYTAVPFTVVTDWLQQGRLLGQDRVRLAGHQKWHSVDTVPALAPYLPRPEPLSADDQAEALEPVELGFHSTRRHDDEDEDVDMIPLIDISLVLLIFFMMTAAATGGMLAVIDTPPAQHQLADLSADMYWIGVELKSRAGTVEKGPDGAPLAWYSYGKDRDEKLAPTTRLADVLAGLAQEFKGGQGEVKIRLRADRRVPIETIDAVTEALQGLQSPPRLRVMVLGEVRAPEGR